MSTKSLLSQLEAVNIDITPGAMEILKNSKIPPKMIIKELTKKWKGRTKPITVKDAIDLMLTSDKYEQISKQLHKELKARGNEFVSVPRRYRHSFYTLKQFKEPVSAGQVAKITKRKTNTEKVYLNFLASEGIIKKIKGKNDKILYLIP
jgi:Fic family protein